MTEAGLIYVAVETVSLGGSSVCLAASERAWKQQIGWVLWVLAAEGRLQYRDGVGGVPSTHTLVHSNFRQTKSLAIYFYDFYMSVQNPPSAALKSPSKFSCVYKNS